MTFPAVLSRAYVYARVSVASVRRFTRPVCWTWLDKTNIVHIAELTKLSLYFLKLFQDRSQLTLLSFDKVHLRLARVPCMHDFTMLGFRVPGPFRGTAGEERDDIVLSHHPLRYGELTGLGPSSHVLGSLCGDSATMSVRTAIVQSGRLIDRLQGSQLSIGLLLLYR